MRDAYTYLLTYLLENFFSFLYINLKLFNILLSFFFSFEPVGTKKRESTPSAARTLSIFYETTSLIYSGSLPLVCVTVPQGIAGIITLTESPRYTYLLKHTPSTKLLLMLPRIIAIHVPNHLRIKLRVLRISFSTKYPIYLRRNELHTFKRFPISTYLILPLVISIQYVQWNWILGIFSHRKSRIHVQGLKFSYKWYLQWSDTIYIMVVLVFILSRNWTDQANVTRTFRRCLGGSRRLFLSRRHVKTSRR